MFTVFELLTLYSVKLTTFFFSFAQKLELHILLSLVFFVSAFVVISSISAVDMFANLCLFISFYLALFSSLTSSETSLSITVLFVLLRTGIYPLKQRARFRFLRCIRRLGQKKKTEREVQAFYKRADGVTP